MKFGKFSLSQAQGATLAHSVRLSSGLLRKGHILSSADIRKMAKNNITHIMAGILEPGDMTENMAATRIAEHISGDHITCAQAFTGRVNLYAADNGLVTIRTQAVNALNHIDEAVTVATVVQNSIVRKGQMVATVKIIPLAVKGETIEKIIREITSGLIILCPFRQRKVMMIQTELAGISDKISGKVKRVMADRLEIFGAVLGDNFKCAHEEAALAELLRNKSIDNHDMIFILGASAITDRRDIIPAAILRAGGEIVHYGMPVDPGNLMLLAKLGNKWVLGLPGCSRSPKLNGIDLVLSRILAGCDVRGEDIMDMGVGGLLSEYPGRPQPREVKTGKKKQKKSAPENIAALVLAAGQSKRMGQENKLMLPYGEGCVLSHVLEQIKEAGIERIFAVTGHQRQEIEREISRHDVIMLYNNLYEEGMSTSLKRGIRSLPHEIDAVIIVLGDMPNISADILKQIMMAYDPASGKSVVVPKYKGKRGNPILWDREFFSEFENLEGDMGAKKLLGEYPEYIYEVDVGSDAIFLDIDTCEAYERLNRT